jgi:murein DD-endopeptidase MepM/ murein hydrolase activator NlpD
MRKIRRSRRLILTAKIYWQLLHVRQKGRMLLRLPLMVILGLAILFAWNGFAPDETAGATFRGTTAQDLTQTAAIIMTNNPDSTLDGDPASKQPGSPTESDSLSEITGSGLERSEWDDVSPPPWENENEATARSTATLAISETSAISEAAPTEATMENPGATAVTAGTAATTTATSSESAAITTFPGIPVAITRLWTFPMKIEPYTPAIGFFGASRTRKRIHAAIDLYAPSRTVICAMTTGRVRDIYVFYQGLMAIEVENFDGTTIRYGELTPLVNVGDLVDQGQPIAKLRRNYDGTCMLHLEIYATVNAGPLTQIDNLDNYLYVPVKAKSYMRRFDLVDPSAIYSLRRPD